ncbi:carbamoyltransferase C-terminal domain-containing protein [Methylobacterium goesingense]|uniref:Carbamoyltransferase n=1 Tax=Methylobacterium goesingense TaxID=243690 RepID=A0ABV2LB48_9HYPH|nr:carbamoyltransferase C-terminal domain-containing protein [Methylobacterium goesingense]GJD76004.1 hypothetical protein CFIICLFH_4251 [Methylobacterium goesingense]
MDSIGYHFGHDAGAAHLDEAGIKRFLSKERFCRIKHALGLSSDDVAQLIDGCSKDTAIGLSSTQNVPIIFDSNFIVNIDGIETGNSNAFFEKIGPTHPYYLQTSWNNNIANSRCVTVDESQFYYETYANSNCNASYETLAMVGYADPVLNTWMRKSAKLSLNGVDRPATFYQHHLLHAFYAAYAISPDKPALIVTGDGGIGPSFAGGGIYFWTPPGNLRPVAPVDGWLGEFYTTVSILCGFDATGGPGKMMGLGPYGRSIHMDTGLIGTRRQVTLDGKLDMNEVVWRWLVRSNVDIAALSNWNRGGRIPPGNVADVAATAQTIIELNLIKLLRSAEAIARRCRHEYESILLCGGLALNCPSNSTLNDVLKVPVLVPPAVNDEGLSIGAAVAAYVDKHLCLPNGPRNFADSVYIGSYPTVDEVEAAGAELGWKTIAQKDTMLYETAQLLAAGMIIGVCSGRSELGPRALGHRSILADPCSLKNWEAVNKIKGRESWRPFAPAVLFQDASNWFDRGPSFSPYMLFNYRCTSKLFPAVTHFDHTARVQHVVPETGLLYLLLEEMRFIGRDPILLNTSFNGPGVPIVEGIYDALAEASRLGLTYVLTDFGLLCREQI